MDLKQRKKPAFIAIVITSAVLIAVLCIFMKIYIIGTPAYSSDVNINWTCSATGDTLTAHGRLLDNTVSQYSVARVKTVQSKDYANVTEITVYKVRSSVIHNTQTFSAVIPVTKDLNVQLAQKGDRSLLISETAVQDTIAEYNAAALQAGLDVPPPPPSKLPNESLQKIYDAYGILPVDDADSALTFEEAMAKYSVTEFKS